MDFGGLVDPRGIEPLSSGCKPDALPLSYGPTKVIRDPDFHYYNLNARRDYKSLCSHSSFGLAVLFYGFFEFGHGKVREKSLGEINLSVSQIPHHQPY